MAALAVQLERAPAWWGARGAADRDLWQLWQRQDAGVACVSTSHIYHTLSLQCFEQALHVRSIQSYAQQNATCGRR